MRKLLVACGALVAMMFTGCIPSPTEQCKMGVAVSCDKAWECTDQAMKDSTTWQGMFGTSAADCKTKMEALAKCAEKTTELQLCDGQKTADGGTATSYDIMKASACSDKMKALSCDDYKAVKLPAECSERCK